MLDKQNLFFEWKKNEANKRSAINEKLKEK